MSFTQYIQNVVSHPTFFVYKTNMMEEGKELFPVIKQQVKAKQVKDHVSIFIPFEVVVVSSEKIETPQSPGSK